MFLWNSVLLSKVLRKQASTQTSDSRSYTGEYASTVCHAQNTEENMRDNASQDMRSLQLENNRGNNAVAYCVDLLQHDPGLQAVIVSLASDPAVWEAFQRNEKIQELMQTRKARCLRQDAVNHIGATFLQHRAFQMNPFLVALCCVRNIVWDTLGKSINLVGNILSFADRKIFGERSSDPLDNPFKACMVVTMLALALVVLKRESN